MTEKKFVLEWSMDHGVRDVLCQIHEQRIPPYALRYLRACISVSLDDFGTPEETLNIA